MTDVLVITAPVGPVYPTINHLHADGFRGGKKSPEYHALFDAVKAAAESEIARTGWTTAAYYCAASLYLYRNTARHMDPSNAGKAEMDALTDAGVWVDDRWARPYVADIEYDPAGESRVVIIVRRRFPDMHFTAAALEPAKPKAHRTRKPRPEAAPIVTAARATSGELMGEINGVPTPRSVMLENLRKKGHL